MTRQNERAPARERLPDNVSQPAKAHAIHPSLRALPDYPDPTAGAEKPAPARRD